MPTAWGPTTAELGEAADLVAAMDDDELAGQVIVGRYAGTDPAEPAALVDDLHLAGVSVTNGNVLDAEQVRATTAAVAEAAADRPYPPVIGIDQEGGTVSHLGDVGTRFPAFADAGRAVAGDLPDPATGEGGGTAGRSAVRAAARATGLELRSLGFTWVWAPVADVTIGSADPTIGSRSASSDPEVAGRTAATALTGYRAAAVVSTTKHFPGHGAVTADSHEVLPELPGSLDDLAATELPPFATAVDRGAPAVMMGHLDVPALDPGVPASLSPAAYALLRDDLGFEGVAITDSLGMGAVAGQDRPAVQALAAGADLLLMPVDTRVTHQVVVDALASGDLGRERVEEAATPVVALQLWQQRWAADNPVPDDVTLRAQKAADALASAASGY
ncbi:glycoside hydrolase family 3 N-terminal domain-containing protein [Nocardioides sp. CFH 31398]|uniref:glycoside hydrolase family 3 N-terminal domain-containing protein n=1 Tax=Nocardioides sp. CFH 31398 TaxID=2919579 RepID=UPI001F05176B|nr:glycoside hydrolase family 3 N-terminal domain-containing protein [Nocardioides sp. CFH 31398]MCH1868334.1 glycosyl hyrolase family 3 [Nocardioides sp. CFH 31398]